MNESRLDVLPHLERAIIRIDKLSKYALDESHRSGRNKARVFKAMLGLERRHADTLAELLRGTLPRALAVRGASDQYGERWMTHHEIVGLAGASAIVTVAWIFNTEAPDVPSLVSCYIDPGEQEKLRKLIADAK